jgi:hypothetical protein
MWAEKNFVHPFVWKPSTVRSFNLLLIDFFEIYLRFTEIYWKSKFDDEKRQWTGKLLGIQITSGFPAINEIFMIQSIVNNKLKSRFWFTYSCIHATKTQQKFIVRSRFLILDLKEINGKLRAIIVNFENYGKLKYRLFSNTIRADSAILTNFPQNLNLEEFGENVEN